MKQSEKKKKRIYQRILVGIFLTIIIAFTAFYLFFFMGFDVGSYSFGVFAFVDREEIEIKQGAVLIPYVEVKEGESVKNATKRLMPLPIITPEKYAECKKERVEIYIYKDKPVKATLSYVLYGTFKRQITDIDTGFSFCPVYPHNLATIFSKDDSNAYHMVLEYEDGAEREFVFFLPSQYTIFSNPSEDETS